MKAGVIGYPIHHSKSPLIHEYWLKQYDIKGTYERIEIKPDDLGAQIKRLVDNNYNGFNVTIPHKENIINLCDEIDDRAKAIGAVNTITINNGKLLGKNTDSFGFIENIKINSSFNFLDKNVLVIGAGGASRAVIYGLIEAGIKEIFLTNRTIEKAKNLQSLAPNKIKIIDWDKKENYLDQTDLVVNTTSLGMTGQRPLDLDLAKLKKDGVVTDIVYSPLMTPLLVDAQSKNLEVITGIGMLLHQARPAFEAWTGIFPEVTSELESIVLA